VPFSPSASQLAGIVATLRDAGCVFAEDEARVLAAAAANPGDLDALAARRAGGLPLEHVVGWADFCGQRIAVDGGVFVPRRRSEFLVREAAVLGRRLSARGGAGGSRCVVVDLCCGSGAIGLALAAALGGAELHAVDIDPAAVTCARRNVGGSGRVYAGDLYEPLPADLRGRVDLLVVNAPYVPTAQIPLLPAEARLHEPRVALDGGSDGVEVHRRVAAQAPRWLSPRGSLLIETSEQQAPLTAGAVTAAGLAVTVVSDDEWAATAVIGHQGGGRRAIALSVRGLPQLGERRRQVAGAPVGVEAARIRQDPDAGVAEPIGPRADGGLALAEGRPVGGDAEHGQPSRLDPVDEREQDLAAVAQFGGGELIGPGGRARDDVGDAESERR
jgi:release factor glutamine methyltransferase